MASKPKTMDTLLVVLKLAEVGFKFKEIERRTSIARNTIRKYLHLLDGRNFSKLSTLIMAILLRPHLCPSIMILLRFIDGSITKNHSPRGREVLFKAFVI